MPCVHYCVCASYMSRAHAVLRSALRRFASRTAFIHSFIHMPTQGHSARGYTGTHTRDMIHSACSGVRGGAGPCVWSVGAPCFFRARGNEAYRRVQRSASTAPIPKGTPSAKLEPHPPRTCTHPPWWTTLRAGAGSHWDPGPPVQRNRTHLFPVPLKEEKYLDCPGE